MEMEKKTRLRAPNFTASDNMLLLDIVEKFKHIIENKKTDGATLQQKQSAWIEIAKIYNSTTSGCTRTSDSIQQNYKNLKKKAKKCASDAKMLIMGTGGGPPPNNDNDPVLDKVKILVGPAIDGMYTVYDGDKDLMATQNKTPIEVEIEETVPKIDEDYENYKTPDGKDYFTNNRSHLKRKPNHLLTRKRKLELETPSKQTVSEKFKKLASSKMELVELQLELLKTQLEDGREQLIHNRMLRAMEVEELQKKYEHNEKLRKLELEKYQ